MYMLSSAGTCVAHCWPRLWCMDFQGTHVFGSAVRCRCLGLRGKVVAGHRQCAIELCMGSSRGLAAGCVYYRQHRSCHCKARADAAGCVSGQRAQQLRVCTVSSAAGGTRLRHNQVMKCWAAASWCCIGCVSVLHRVMSPQGFGQQAQTSALANLQVVCEFFLLHILFQ